MEGYGVSQIRNHSTISWNQLVNKQSVKREERSVLKEKNCLFASYVQIIKDFEGSRPIYITCRRPRLFLKLYLI